jgi:hypothetical protein
MNHHPSPAVRGPGIDAPGVRIGIDFSEPPRFERVPGYPAYYAPRQQANLFFYDGLYWVYEGDEWYASSWYNGPWSRVAPQLMPVYVLRIPVRYYRAPPSYFGGWRRDAAPRWDQRWGDDWSRDRRGWDRWDRRAAPQPAPLPVYQRRYTGERYPSPEQQQAIRRDNYRYQPRDTQVRQHLTPPTPPRVAAPVRQPPPPKAQPPGQARKAADAKGPEHNNPGRGNGRDKDRGKNDKRDDKRDDKR